MKDTNAMSKESEIGSAQFEQNADSARPSSVNTGPNLTLLETGQNPGSILKAAREKLGLDVSEVSAKTKINEHQVIAIESGDLDRLPPATFAKAFIKSYCKVVGLDPDPVLLAFGFEGPAPKPQHQQSSSDSVSKRVVNTETTFEPAMPDNSRRLSSLSFDRKSSSKKAGLFIVLAALALFAAVYLPEFLSGSDEQAIGQALPLEEPVAARVPEQAIPVDSEPSSVESGSFSTESGSVASVEGVGSQSSESAFGPADQAVEVPGADNQLAPGMVAEPLPLRFDSSVDQLGSSSVFPSIRQEQEKVVAVQEKPVAVQEKLTIVDPKPSVSPPKATQPPKKAEVAVVEPSLPVLPKPAPNAFKIEPGNSALQFVFSVDSWVTVRDSTNRVLLSQINPAGGKVQIQGRPPFKLIVGKASSVRLFKDGQPVDLTPFINGEVAKLTLH
jgi:cytoskeleton protein RodZ